MKILQITIFSLLASAFVNGQVNTSLLEQNNVRSHVLDNGSLFSNIFNSSSGYIIPKTGNSGIMYALNINMLALDFEANPYFSKSVYEETTWSGGPIRSNYSQQSTPTISCVNKTSVDYHLGNFHLEGYTVIDQINYWPTHGDTTNGEAWYLAPFNDVDGNGIYSPENGDYPCIKGDRACYIIINDSDPTNQISGLNSLGVEAHMMIYQFNSTNPAINEATYFDIKAFNRSDVDYTKFILGIFMDGDIGGSADDYIGTNLLSSTMYFYNGDLFDENMFGANGYGLNPPAAGITNMNNDMIMTNYLPNNNLNFTNFQLFNIFSGHDSFGAVRPESFIYTGNYDSGISEYSEGNTPNDRRGYASYGRIDLSSGDSHEWNFAITYGRDLDAQHIFSSVETMLESTAEVKAFFETIEACALNTASLVEKTKTEKQIRIFPNPTSTILNIELEDNSTVIISNSLGQHIETFQAKGGTNKLNVSNYQDGIYFATISSASTNQTIKWIKNR